MSGVNDKPWSALVQLACVCTVVLACGTLSVSEWVEQSRGRWKPMPSCTRYDRLTDSASARRCNGFFTAAGEELGAGQAGVHLLTLAATIRRPSIVLLLFIPLALLSASPQFNIRLSVCPLVGSESDCVRARCTTGLQSTRL